MDPLEIPILLKMTCIRMLYGILLVFIAFSAFALEPAYLTAMRIQPSPSSTRILFSLSKKTYGKVKYLPAAKRITVEFSNTAKRFSIQQATLPGSNVASISADNFSPNNVRISLAVVGKIRWVINFITDEKKPGAT